MATGLIKQKNFRFLAKISGLMYLRAAAPMVAVARSYANFIKINQFKPVIYPHTYFFSPLIHIYVHIAHKKTGINPVCVVADLKNPIVSRYGAKICGLFENTR